MSTPSSPRSLVLVWQRAAIRKIFPGEAIHPVFRGIGTVWLQSLPFSRLADRIIRSAPVVGGESVEQSSFLSGILNSKG